MNEVILKCAEENYENYQKYYDKNKANMNVEENVKCFTKLLNYKSIYEKILDDEDPEKILKKAQRLESSMNDFFWADGYDLEDAYKRLDELINKYEKLSGRVYIHYYENDNYK